MKEIIIDAKNRVLGRVATEVAVALRGKNTSEYIPNAAPKIKVKVINFTKVKMTGKKTEQKTYKKYSGYPGSLRYTPFSKMMEKDPQKLFKKIVNGMLPKNKLTKEFLRNLTVES